MKLYLCSLQDTKVGAFAPVMSFRSKGEAIRSLEEAKKDTQSMIGKYPGDYVLWMLGEMDDQTGQVEPFLARMIGADELG